jgi:hypothetical protein
MRLEWSGLESRPTLESQDWNAQFKIGCHSERTGPRTSFSSGVPKERSLLFGVELGGGESKNLLLFFDEFQTHHTSTLRLKGWYRRRIDGLCMSFRLFPAWWRR